MKLDSGTVRVMFSLSSDGSMTEMISATESSLESENNTLTVPQKNFPYQY